MVTKPSLYRSWLTINANLNLNLNLNLNPIRNMNGHYLLRFFSNLFALWTKLQMWYKICLSNQRVTSILQLHRTSRELMPLHSLWHSCNGHQVTIKIHCEMIFLPVNHCQAVDFKVHLITRSQSHFLTAFIICCCFTLEVCDIVKRVQCYSLFPAHSRLSVIWHWISYLAV